MGLLVRFPAGNTMNHLLGLLLLAAASQALPAPEPQFGFGHPLLYHAPNCTTEEDTVTTKSCKPVTANECEDVEIPGSKIEYVDNCRNATVQQCGLRGRDVRLTLRSSTELPSTLWFLC